MNYWSSFVTNLQEVTGPLYDLFHSVQESGTIVARQMYVLLLSCLTTTIALGFANGEVIRYNCSGWVSHHNTDLYGDSAPQVSFLSLNLNLHTHHNTGQLRLLNMVAQRRPVRPLPPLPLNPTPNISLSSSHPLHLPQPSTFLTH